MKTAEFDLAADQLTKALEWEFDEKGACIKRISSSAQRDLSDLNVAVGDRLMSVNDTNVEGMDGQRAHSKYLRRRPWVTGNDTSIDIRGRGRG